MDQFSNDKIFFHTDKLLSVIHGKIVNPSVYEISLCGSCNCECSYCCCRNYHDDTMLSYKDLELLATQISQNDGGAVVLTGGGEPMVNPLFADAVRLFHAAGLSVGVISNGLLLEENSIAAIVECAGFFRISLDTVNPAQYRRLRGVTPDIGILSANMSSLAMNKRKHGSTIRLGAQVVYIDQSLADIKQTIQFCRKTGIDFIQIRPVDNVTGMHMERNCYYGFYRENGEDLMRLKEEYTDDSFQVILNDNKFREYYKGAIGKTYSRCLGANFTASIGHDMCLYFCCANIGNPDHNLGSLREHSLSELLTSEKRCQMIEYPDFGSCQAQCRNHVINKILDQLTHMPPEEAVILIQQKSQGEIPEHAEFL